MPIRTATRRLRDAANPAAGSIADCGTRAERLLGWLLLASAAMLATGLLMPVVKVDRFLILTDQISVLGGAMSLFKEGEYLLGSVVLLFSAVFPFFKLQQAWSLWRDTDVNDPRFGRKVQRLDWLSRWSMVDVLVIALIVFSVKATGFADASSESGLYFFVGAFAGTALSLAWIKRAADRLQDGQAEDDTGLRP